VTAALIEQWIASRRAAEARERRELRAGGAPDPRQATSQGLAVIALAGRLHGWPAPEDPVSEREATAAREQWSKLHAALRPH
jgi:hypothetical protein